ncbi:hypothetical protein D3C75_1342120 [compost metagenome]
MGVGLPGIPVQLQNAPLTAQQPLYEVIARLHAVHIAIQWLGLFSKQVLDDRIEIGGDDTAVGEIS